jgi:hypothetical protein
MSEQPLSQVLQYPEALLRPDAVARRLAEPRDEPTTERILLEILAQQIAARRHLRVLEIIAVLAVIAIVVVAIVFAGWVK